jgi:maleylpyruvate isomerase
VPQHLPGGTVVSEWLVPGERFFLDRVPADLTAPSLLPGWTRAHVVAHLVGSCEALGNLLHWARTGIETPMYASVEARAAEIERRAALPPAELVRAATEGSARLLAAFEAMPAEAWGATVRTVQGRTVPASELPWMRTRETWIHAVDLDAGAGFGHLPPELSDALLTEVAVRNDAHEDCPGVTLMPSDRDRTWAFGSGARQPVGGTAGELLGWVLGRPSTVDGPALPRWL